MDYLIYLNGRVLPGSVGKKALQLRRLAGIGMRIPETYVIPWEAYQRYLADDVRMVEELRRELARWLKPEVAYAVRSSANIEDGLERSFAGQFKSVLNMRGADGVLQAVWSVWGSASAPIVQAYQEKHALVERELLMAVIVQEMVQPAWAGVALSRNPVTGADEVVVEAVPGAGEALVQSGVTPRRWIHKWGAYAQQPEDGCVPPGLIDQVVAGTRAIAAKLRAHVDLEWAYDGAQLYWLQAREITALHRRNVYSNHLSKEMLPGMVKPLIGSINIPLVCAMWIDLVSEMAGKVSVRPEDLARAFYYRIYFNMGTLGRIFEEVGMPADSVETLMGVTPPGASKPGMRPTPKTFLRLPNLLWFLVDKWFFAPKMRAALQRIRQEFEAVDYRGAGRLEPEQLLREIDRLYEKVQYAVYYSIVGPLLMMMYNRALEGQLKKLGVDPARFDLMAGMDVLHDYDPNYHLGRLHEQFTRLDPAVQAQVRASDYETFRSLPGLAPFQRQVALFLERFGQFSDSGNDFSAVPWRDTPGLVLELVANFSSPAGAAAPDAPARVSFSDLRLRGLQRLKVGLLYRRAREFRLFREQVSASYTYGYGLFRYFYLALGAHFTRQGLLDDPQDIFYLDDSQVRLLVEVGASGPDARQIVAKHKQDMKRFEHIALPGVIYGDETPPVEDASLEKLSGVPTSIGHYTGKVTVVCGIKDFNKVKRGDVLVIPYSDVGWTPLFARAGAVVAESGGLLSHSSIVAREYNIPAVVSVAGATQLQDGTLVTVNGHNGQVLIHNDHTETS